MREPLVSGAKLNAALDYARHGLFVFPCAVRGKHPLTHHGFKDASTDEPRIREWWAKHPDANIGVTTGAPGPDVLDVDVRPDGDGLPALERLKAAGLLKGAIRIIRTPSSGLHVWFPGTRQPCSSLPGLHLDLKASGGYVLVPPSHVVAASYAGHYVELDRRDVGAPLDWTAARRLLVPELVHPTKRPTATSSGKLEHLVVWLLGQRPGGRNRALFWAACRALSEGHDDLELLEEAGQAIGLPQLETRRAIQSARSRMARSGR